MRPFNVYVEGPADELPGRLGDAIAATFQADADHGGSDSLARTLAGDAMALVDQRTLGDNVSGYAVNVGAASTDGRDVADATLDVIQFNVRAIRRDAPAASSEPASQV